MIISILHDSSSTTKATFGNINYVHWERFSELHKELKALLELSRVEKTRMCGECYHEHAGEIKIYQNSNLIFVRLCELIKAYNTLFDYSNKTYLH